MTRTDPTTIGTRSTACSSARAAEHHTRLSQATPGGVPPGISRTAPIVSRPRARVCLFKPHSPRVCTGWTRRRARRIRGRCACGLWHQHARFDLYRRAERPKDRSRKCRAKDERDTYSVGALASARGETRRTVVRIRREPDRGLARVFAPQGRSPGIARSVTGPRRVRARGAPPVADLARDFHVPVCGRRAALPRAWKARPHQVRNCRRTPSRRRTTHPKTSTKFWTRRCRPAACSAARARPARRRRKDGDILVARAMYALSLSEAGCMCLVCFHSTPSTFGL
jgi:hypothetical protein